MGARRSRRKLRTDNGLGNVCDIALPTRYEREITDITVADAILATMKTCARALQNIEQRLYVPPVKK